MTGEIFEFLQILALRKFHARQQKQHPTAVVELCLSLSLSLPHSACTRQQDAVSQARYHKCMSMGADNTTYKQEAYIAEQKGTFLFVCVDAAGHVCGFPALFSPIS